MKNILLSLLLVLSLFSCKEVDSVYNIKDFGAVGDGETKNTKAINMAITTCSVNGGGKVIVPPGTFMTGTVELKDNVTLEIMQGATILGSPDHEDYKFFRRPYFRYFRKEIADSLEYLIMAYKCKNVKICGEGTINGNGKAFWEEYDSLPTWIHAKKGRVSNMIEAHYCENFSLTGVRLEMSPEWTVHIFDSKNIFIDGITIDNGLFGPNNDGIDITGCEDIIISNCNITTCDDAICFKTAYEGGECKNAVVTNCIIKTNCVALKLGSNLTYHPMKNITFSNCVITESSRGIGIYSTLGAEFENISFSNIFCKTNAPLVLNRPIHISVWNKPMYKREQKTNSSLKNVTISNFTAETDGRILMVAQDGCNIENLSLNNIKISYKFIEDPAEIAPGHKSHQGSPMNPEARGARAAIVAENIKNLNIDGLDITWPADTVPQEWKITERIENGTNRKFKYDYAKPKQTELSVLWAKNVTGTFNSKSYSLSASSDKTQKFVIEKSDIKSALY
jgi:polygalacturonase